MNVDPDKNPLAPRVVALVPTWNAAAFIEETLDSLAAQTYSNLSVLISNDASTDETGEICERYAERDARFRVIHQPENLGWIGNVNALFAAAEGEYFFFAFHDDILLPEYVKSLVRPLEADPEAVLAFSDIELVNIDLTDSMPSFRELDGITDRYDRVRVMARKPRYNWIPNRGIFRASAPAKVGGLRRNLAGEFVADWPWLLSLLVLGTFVRVPEVLCRKYYKEKSVSVAWSHSPLSRGAVILSCAGVIRRAPFSLREKLTLYIVLARSYPLMIWPTIRRRLSRVPVLRRIRSVIGQL